MVGLTDEEIEIIRKPYLNIMRMNALKEQEFKVPHDFTPSKKPIRKNFLASDY